MSTYGQATITTEPTVALPLTPGGNIYLHETDRDATLATKPSDDYLDFNMSFSDFLAGVGVVSSNFGQVDADQEVFKFEWVPAMESQITLTGAKFSATESITLTPNLYFDVTENGASSNSVSYYNGAGDDVTEAPQNLTFTVSADDSKTVNYSINSILLTAYKEDNLLAADLITTNSSVSAPSKSEADVLSTSVTLGNDADNATLSANVTDIAMTQPNITKLIHQLVDSSQYNTAADATAAMALVASAATSAFAASNVVEGILGGTANVTFTGTGVHTSALIAQLTPVINFV